MHFFPCLGEICLPGGHQDNVNEAPVETALREAQEEIQLDPGLVKVITVLPPFLAGCEPLFAVTPIVCTLLPKPEELLLVPNNEVEYAFWVPLRVFLEGRRYSVIKGWWFNGWNSADCIEYTEVLKPKTLPSPNARSTASKSTQSPEQTTYTNHHIWGLTATVCIVLSAIALNRVPDFPCTIGLIQNVDERKKVVVLQNIAFSSDQIRRHVSYDGNDTCRNPKAML